MPTTAAPAPGPVALIAVRRGLSIEVPEDAAWWERNLSVHLARLRDAAGKSPGAIAVLQSAVLLHGGHLKTPPDQAHLWLSWTRKTRAHEGPSLWILPRSDRKERLARRPIVDHHMELDMDRLVEINGILTTDVEQTILMSARFLPVD